MPKQSACGIFVRAAAILAVVLLAAPRIASAVPRDSAISRTKEHPAIESVKPTAKPPAKPEVVTIVLVGDTGFSGHREPVDAAHGRRKGQRHPYAALTRDIAPLINGNLNFANIETVVTDRNGLGARAKLFNFRMHPNAARHLVDIGFNLFSLANNHAADYGKQGIADTIRHAANLESAGLRAHAGLGANVADATAPRRFSVGRSRFAFSAMGIGAGGSRTARAGLSTAGQVNIHDPESFRVVVGRLRGASADYRILSMHFGEERVVRPTAEQVVRWRNLTRGDDGVDLVVGHHPHVAQGIARVNDRVIVYGLGNFLHLGTANMARFDICRDFGLLVRVYVARGANEKPAAEAIEIVPLTNMHVRPRPMEPKAARLRIAIMNAHAKKLDDTDAGSSGVRFAPQPDGTGLYCRAGAASKGGKLATLCAGFTPGTVPAGRLASRIRNACRRLAPRVTARRPGRRGKRRSRRVEWGYSEFFDSGGSGN